MLAIPRGLIFLGTSDYFADGFTTQDKNFIEISKQRCYCFDESIVDTTVVALVVLSNHAFDLRDLTQFKKLHISTNAIRYSDDLQSIT